MQMANGAAVRRQTHRSRQRAAGTQVPDELMRAVWRGDEETFARLFDAWFAVLYAAAWQRTRDRARAEALTREMAVRQILDAAERPLRGTRGRAR
jgi:hypothetical protein